MAWLAVDKDGTENIFQYEPMKCFDRFQGQYDDWGVTLPKGTILKLLSRRLTYRDSPVEIK